MQRLNLFAPVELAEISILVLYRDDIRRFFRGDQGMVKALAHRIVGSPDLYPHLRRGPNYSIHFVTCHDGFTLYDLVSYGVKHNEANGEDNHDGNDANWSWNCDKELCREIK